MLGMGGGTLFFKPFFILIYIWECFFSTAVRWGETVFRKNSVVLHFSHEHTFFFLGSFIFFSHFQCTNQLPFLLQPYIICTNNAILMLHEYKWNNLKYFHIFHVCIKKIEKNQKIHEKKESTTKIQKYSFAPFDST